LWLSWGRDFLIFFVAGMRRESFGMELAREILDGRNNSWRGAIYGVADDGKAAVTDGLETTPSGALGKHVEIILPAFGMGRGENQEVWLQADNFLETHVRPVLRGVNDGCGAGKTKRIGNKGVLAGGDQRIGPNDEQNAARRHAIQTLLKIGEMAIEISAKSCASFRDAEHIGKTLCGGDDIFHGMGIGAVGRNTEAVESVHGFDEIKTFRDENEIGPESGNLFEAWIDRAADFGFFLSVGRIIAEVRVTNEAILQAKGVDRFRETWSK
jgi:hypothetical protein